MPIIEGYWDCPYCGGKAIRGSERVCPSCGKTRSADTKFYMLGTKPVADESAVEKGADWFCPYCDSYNPDSAQFCRNCGHEREASDEDYFHVQQRREEERREAEAELSHLTQPQAAPATRSAAPRRGLAIVLILALILSGVFLLGPKNRDVTILEKYWQRSVEVEEYRLVEENGWVLPEDSVELLRTAREIHHYDQVLDHYETVSVQRSRQVQDGYDTYTTYEDMGNGYFESVEHSTPRYRTEYYTETYEEPVYRSVPVYDTKYYYTIWRWEYDRTETAEGADEPYWPDIPQEENLREGDRAERYTVTCGWKKDKTATYVCDYDLWSRLEQGGSYSITVRGSEIVEVK